MHRSGDEVAVSAAEKLELMQLRQRIEDLEFQLLEATRDRDLYQRRAKGMAAAVRRYCERHPESRRLLDVIAVLEGKGING